MLPLVRRLVLAVALVFAAGEGVVAPWPAHAEPGDPALAGWVWPLERFRIAEPFAAPATSYGPGHRGIDLEAVGSAAVRAPASGIVAFSGRVVDRGVLTIDHGDGLVTTLEPVDSPLRPGDPVARGDEVGTVSLGGHAAPGLVHFGVRRDGEYINPMLLLGGVPRAVLLPCCGPAP